MKSFTNLENSYRNNFYFLEFWFFSFWCCNCVAKQNFENTMCENTKPHTHTNTIFRVIYFREKLKKTDFQFSLDFTWKHMNYTVSSSTLPNTTLMFTRIKKKSFLLLLTLQQSKIWPKIEKRSKISNKKNLCLYLSC